MKVAASLLRTRPSPTSVAVGGQQTDAAGKDPSGSALHLAEGRDGWTLTITLTPDLLEVIDEARRSGRSVAGRTSDGVMPGCQVHVQPNLVPGDPFAVDAIRVVTSEPTATPGSGNPDASVSTKGRVAP